MEKFVRVKNLCAHPVNIIDPSGMKLTFEPSGTVARVTTDVSRSFTEVEVAPGVKVEIPVSQFTSGDITGLPEPEEGTMYLVSFLIASTVKRPDVFCPDTAESSAIKDGLGNILGVRNLRSYA